MRIQQRTTKSESRTPNASGYARSFDVLRSMCDVRCSSESGSVLIIVLWIALGLVSITLYFANSNSLELQAADNRVSGMESDQAIDGAARYVNYILVNYATNGTMPDQDYYQSAAVPVGDAHFWLIGRDTNSPPSNPSQVVFGLTDENSKLNLNMASLAMLSNLPRITSDFAANIITWRTNGDTTSGGVGPQQYAMLSPSYEPKQAPFESADELRLVYGADMETLVGADANRNGALDPNENDEDHNGIVDPGIVEYVTAYSREPNTQSDGTALINVSSLTPGTLTKLRSLLSTNLTSDRATNVMRRLNANNTSFKSPLQFYVASGMTADEFALVAGQISVTTNQFIDGRININTANPAVIACIPGLTNSADQIINYRLSNPDKLTSIAWVIDAMGVSGTQATQLATQIGDRITIKSYQFMADVAALGPYGRGYRRVRFIFDTSSGTPKIIYRRDLTHLGWALGKDVRQIWLAKNTQQQ
jgi:type II secretory pathway component PulK